MVYAVVYYKVESKSMAVIHSMVFARHFFPFTFFKYRKKSIAFYFGMNFGKVEAVSQRKGLEVNLCTTNYKHFVFACLPGHLQRIGKRMYYLASECSIMRLSGNHYVAAMGQRPKFRSLSFPL